MDDFLMHYGILGMKWGVRRYRNEDGTLTEAGKKRYSSTASTESADTKKNRRRRAATVGAVATAAAVGGLAAYEKHAENKENREAGAMVVYQPKKSMTTDDYKAIGAIAGSSSKAFKKSAERMRKDAAAEAKYKPMDLSNMTDQELRDRINRANLEKTYTQMFGEKETVNKGKRAVADVLDTAGDVLAFTGTAITIALAIKTLKDKKK